MADFVFFLRIKIIAVFDCFSFQDIRYTFPHTDRYGQQQDWTVFRYPMKKERLVQLLFFSSVRQNILVFRQVGA